MAGINGGEFLILAVIVLLVVGPERLPHYAAQLGRMVRELRRMAEGARDQVKAELGPDFDDIDWAKLDPRQYDPRRIVREALSDVMDDAPAKRTTGSTGSSMTASTMAASAMAASSGVGEPMPTGRSRGRHAASAVIDEIGCAPFDTEAT